jgi:hypothetical protein
VLDVGTRSKLFEVTVSFILLLANGLEKSEAAIEMDTKGAYLP